MRCIIKRSTDIWKKISPEYDLYLANGLKHILSVKKYPLSNRGLFKFSTNMLRFNDNTVLATMHANVSHNIYWLLHPPRNIKGINLSIVEMLVGYYKLREAEQRKFTVMLPQMNKKYHLALDF